MPKYIDVENLNLKGIAVFDENLDLLIPLSDVRKAIQMTPAADVEEVKHGYWIPSPDGINPIRCNKCNTPAPFAFLEDEFCETGFYRYPWNYCPNCGAKMKGGE